MTPIRLTSWSVIDRQPNTFMRLPESRVQCLNGAVIGHPRHADGNRIVTSPISHRDGDYVVTTSGSVYELLDVDPSYEAVFPNARARLLASLPTGKVASNA